MITLAIETSCDETGVAIVDSKSVFSHRILINLLASQVKVHKEFGGVVPGLAAREHTKNLPFLIKKAFKECGNRRIDAIAYTSSPGLEPALLVGRTFAKTFGYGLGVPVYPINHLYGHIVSCFAGRITNYELRITNLFPAVALVISGGHTQLYRLQSFQKFELIGETVDDAVGEALDKGARLLGLPYPGGPEIEKLAKKGHKGAFILPSPMISSPDLQFSFSGLKTALLYKIRDLQKNEKNLDIEKKENLAFAYQKAAFDVLEAKTKKALQKEKAQALFIGGGVAANQTLKERFEMLLKEEFPGVLLFIPEPKFATDNGVMIALAHAIPSLSQEVKGSKGRDKT